MKGNSFSDRAFLTRRVRISCLHELRSEALSEKENLELFGPCYRTHGHDYYIDVTITGTIDKTSGLICNRDLFDDLLDKHLKSKFHGTHLNTFFKFTTGERLAVEFFNYLKPLLPSFEIISIGVQETPKNYFVVRR